MAGKKNEAPSFDDFNEENLIDTPTEEVVDQEEEVEKEEEEEKPKVSKKTKTVEAKAPEKKVKKEAPKEETPEEEEEIEIPKDKLEDNDKNPDLNKDQDEDETDPEAFIAEVEKLTGHEIDVDYGDTDPLSPQGVAIRELALKEVVLDNWLEELETKFPQVFRALKHANNGGNVADLFTQTLARDYSNLVIKEDDEALAKDVLKDYYKSKGVKSDDRIKKMILADEESEGGLVKEAQAALAELKADQDTKNKSVVEEQAQRKADQDKKNKIMATAVDEVITNRQLGSFKIADKAEAQQFKEYVFKNIRQAANGYELATPVDSANLSKALQYQYFQFKGGDLSKIIQQKAESVVAKKMSLRFKTEQSSMKKNRNQEDTNTQRQNLSDFEVD